MTTKLQWVEAPYPEPQHEDPDTIREARVAITPSGMMVVRDDGPMRYGRRYEAQYRAEAGFMSPNSKVTTIGSHFLSFEEAMAACDEYWSEL